MRDQVDAAAIVVGKAGAYGGGATAVVAGLTANELAAIVGAMCAVLGLLVQWNYTRRRRKREDAAELREREFHDARMQAMRERRHDQAH